MHHAQCVKYRSHIEITITLQVFTFLMQICIVGIEEQFHVDSKKIN